MEDMWSIKPHVLEMQQYGRGIYPNEAYYYLEENRWKTEYWGDEERYNRLLRIKQEWDPEHIFTCYRCVGSDLYQGP